MPKKKQPERPSENPLPGTNPEIVPVHDPEEPLNIPEEDPDIVMPDDEPTEAPPYEVPPPGEGP